MDLASLGPVPPPRYELSLADLDETGVYRGFPRLDPGLRRAAGSTEMLPAAQTFAEVAGDLVFPHTPLDIALMVLGGRSAEHSREARWR